VSKQRWPQETRPPGERFADALNHIAAARAHC
jgi:hypothetical protein